MKPTVSPQARQAVLDLRRCHSLRQVAQRTGLPLGTVKTICSRSGAFRDNQTLRELCTVPPIQQSESTTLIVPDLPPQDVVTGDNEVDAVLWLRQVISTGQAALIEKAMLAAKRIKAPMAELEKRYSDHLVAQNPGHFTDAWGSFGFADLKGLANTSTVKLTRQHEALSRFGSVDALFDKTPSEQFCIDALAGLKPKSGELDAAQVEKRFRARPDLMPQTLSDCLHELAYWDNLYTIRKASHDNAGDHWPEVYGRTDFVFRSLARIRARTKEEAVAAFRYLADSDYMDREEINEILMNLIGSPSQ